MLIWTLWYQINGWWSTAISKPEQLIDNEQVNLYWITLVKSEASKTTYFGPFLAYDVIIKLMAPLKSIIFLKAHDGKHYLDNQSEDSSKGYRRKGICHLQFLPHKS